ncbi:MAG: membrane protein insertion efficiency factor YidD [Tatlockia sp.]
MGQSQRITRKLMCLPIVLYRYLLSPVITPCCRYYPSCSQYAITAIMQFGVIKGTWLAFCRLMRCHPWARGGYDPVSLEEEKF